MGLSLITDLKRAREYKVVAVTTVNMNVWTNVLVKVVLTFLYTKNPKQTKTKTVMVILVKGQRHWDIFTVNEMSSSYRAISL